MLTPDLDVWIADALARRVDRQPFAVLRDGVVIGSTSYMSLAPEHLRLEIGNTWLHPSTWGTGANVEAKYLLLRHAFEELGCRRVEFKTDALNERAARRWPRCPSEFEGIHRKHMLVRGRRAARLGLVRRDRRRLAGGQARARGSGWRARLRLPGIRYGTGAFDGRERQRHRSRPRRVGSRRAARGARRRAARGRRRARAALRAGRGHRARSRRASRPARGSRTSAGRPRSRRSTRTSGASRSTRCRRSRARADPSSSTAPGPRSRPRRRGPGAGL